MSHKIRSYILEPEKSSNHSRKFPWPTANHTNCPLSRKSSSLKSSVYDSRGVPEHIHTHTIFIHNRSIITQKTPGKRPPRSAFDRRTKQAGAAQGCEARPRGGSSGWAQDINKDLPPDPVQLMAGGCRGVAPDDEHWTCSIRKARLCVCFLSGVIVGLCNECYILACLEDWRYFGLTLMIFESRNDWLMRFTYWWIFCFIFKS